MNYESILKRSWRFSNMRRVMNRMYLDLVNDSAIRLSASLSCCLQTPNWVRRLRARCILSCLGGFHIRSSTQSFTTCIAFLRKRTEVANLVTGPRELTASHALDRTPATARWLAAASPAGAGQCQR